MVKPTSARSIFPKIRARAADKAFVIAASLPVVYGFQIKPL